MSDKALRPRSPRRDESARSRSRCIRPSERGVGGVRRLLGDDGRASLARSDRLPDTARALADATDGARDRVARGGRRTSGAGARGDGAQARLPHGECATENARSRSCRVREMRCSTARARRPSYWQSAASPAGCGRACGVGRGRRPPLTSLAGCGSPASCYDFPSRYPICRRSPRSGRRRLGRPKSGTRRRSCRRSKGT